MGKGRPPRFARKEKRQTAERRYMEESKCKRKHPSTLAETMRYAPDKGKRFKTV